MADSDSGYYSPNETVSYLPQVERGNGGIVQALMFTAVKDCKSCCIETRRYWSAAFDRRFLMSSASRRDLWRLILPLPGLIAMVTDHGNPDLMYLDAALSVSLFLMSSLPMGWIISDLIFCLMFAAYLPVHHVLTIQQGFLSAAGPVLATFTLAAAGINVGMIACFASMSAIAAPYVAFAWSIDQIAACAYVTFVAMLIERRATLLVGSGDFNTEVGYKAIGLTSIDDTSMAGVSRAEVLPSRYPESWPGGGVGSDTEDWRPLPQQPGWVPSALDNLMTKLGRGDGKAGPLSSIFSRFGSGPLTSGSVSSRSAQSRQRFAGEQISQPGAACHEAPEFDRALLDMEGGRGDEVRSEISLPFPGRSLSPTSSYQSLPLVPGSPSRWSANEALRAIKLSGFQNLAINSLFVEKKDRSLWIADRETYWTTDGKLFLYKSAATNTWAVGKEKRFSQIKEAKSNGLAHSPAGLEIWQEVNEQSPVNNRKDWREWDPSIPKWVYRSGSGVVSCGKVRQKRAKGVDAAVQTAYEVVEQEVNTDHPEEALRREIAETAPRRWALFVPPAVKEQEKLEASWTGLPLLPGLSSVRSPALLPAESRDHHGAVMPNAFTRDSGTPLPAPSPASTFMMSRDASPSSKHGRGEARSVTTK
eukprot:TRINITY_DN4997_c0_g1_i2.p1 TRINITY_DN4997_c0_g1~~TRINITY_DN4997_c0_g1_i2.p1  ORF type:complete len:645 (+),score=115.83 TRINITY_DN4997_c0_g1_i2:78-2012(+)